MAQNNTNPAALTLLALDIGGTKTHAGLYREGKLISEARSGSANVQNVSKEQAQQALAQVINALGAPTVDLVIAGAGGVDTDRDAQALRELIKPLVPGAQIRAVHDTRLILAAGHAHHGIAVILGTGSVAWGVNVHGQQARSGGWGYLLGDEGAGYWFGREAVRSALREANLGLPPGKLSSLVLEHVGCASAEELIAQFHQQADRGRWADCAPLVFEARRDGDQNAERIISDAVTHASEMVSDVARQISLTAPVVIGGGVIVHQPVYQEKLRAALIRAGHDDVRFLTSSPVHGAAFLAGH